MGQLFFCTRATHPVQVEVWDFTPDLMECLRYVIEVQDDFADKKAKQAYAFERV